MQDQPCTRDCRRPRRAALASPEAQGMGRGANPAPSPKLQGWQGPQAVLCGLGRLQKVTNLLTLIALIWNDGS